MELKELEIIGFRTINSWYASDVLTLSESVMKIYNAFLAARKYEEIQQKYYANYFHTLSQYKNYFMDFPFSERFYDLYNRWIDLYEEYLLDKRKKLQYFKLSFPSPPPFPFPFQAMPFPQVKTNALEIYHDLDNYTSEEDHIRIYKIKIASNGGFSFTGIGDIIKEIRELIKDLWYRNKQDKTKGQLEIIERYLSIKQKNQNNNDLNLGSFNSQKELMDNIDAAVRNIKMLEEKAKIKDVPEYLEYVEVE